MMIAIIAAMHEELACILKRITHSETITIGDYTFHQGQYGVHTVVVTLSGVGKAAAAGVTGMLIGRFEEIDTIIITGLAGALDPTLKLGDVVVSTQCIQHDVDARPNCRTKYQVPFSKAIFEADPQLVEIGQRAVNTFLRSHLHEQIKAEDLALFNIEQPRCITGAVATGDEFMTNPERLAAIRADIQNTLNISSLAIDMETAAVIAIAGACHKRAVSFRVISDKGINEHYLQFKRSIAGQYTAGIIDLVLKHLPCDEALKKNSLPT